MVRRPEDLATSLSAALGDVLAGNVPYFGGGGPRYYGVRAENVAPDGSALDLVLTFRSGVRCCCTGLRCHCAVDEPSFWDDLRMAMNVRGLGVFDLPTIRVVRLVIEEGVLVETGRRGFVAQGARFDVETGPFPPRPTQVGD